MSDITLVGIDLAKNVFQVQAEDPFGNVVEKKRMNRTQLKHYMGNLPPCLVAMEACGSAHYWGRFMKEMQHTPQLIAPRIVKAWVLRNKNDARDTDALCTAARSKKVTPIPVKTIAQQNLTCIHRARSQVMKRRTQITNHLRAQLSEYGLVTGRGFAPLKKLVLEVLEGQHELLTGEAATFVFEDLYKEWQSLNERIKRYDTQVKQLAKSCPRAVKLMDIPGIGELTSTALIAKVDDFSAFRKGRDFAAWLGLTPREYASGEKRVLGKISKQGDRYLRTLLIHGARGAIRGVLKKDKDANAYTRWIHQLVQRIGMNKAAVALANKHARMIWALCKHGRVLNLNFSDSFLNNC